MPKGLMVAIAILVLMTAIVPGQATVTAFDKATVSDASVAGRSIVPTADGLPAAVASAGAGTPEPVSLMVVGSALIAVGLAMKRGRKSA